MKSVSHKSNSEQTPAKSFEELRDSAEAATYFGQTERAFLTNVRRGKIPVVRINQRVLRFHLPSIMAALQKGGQRQ